MQTNSSEIKPIEINLKIIYQETSLILNKKDSLSNTQSKLNNANNSTIGYELGNDLLSQNQSYTNKNKTPNGLKVKFKSDFLEIIDVQCWKTINKRIAGYYTNEGIKCKCVLF